MKYIKLKYTVCEANVYFKGKFIGVVWKEEGEKWWACESFDGVTWDLFPHEKDAIQMLVDHYDAK